MLISTNAPSPIGTLRLIASDDALVGVYTFEDPRGPRVDARETAAHPVLDAAKLQLAEYFAGARTCFELPLAPNGSDFQRAVWRALQEIPYGTHRSYAEIAARLGKPTASRAVGAANGANPLSIVVPCHRVIGASGALTGYAGGLRAKEWLLSHEATARGALTPATRRAVA